MIVNNITRRIQLLFLFLASLSSCNEKSSRTKLAEEILAASLDAIAPVSVRAEIQNLVSVANCRSPQGSYSTEVQTDSGGYMYFRQTYSYKPAAFEAVILNRTKGYAINDSLQVLPREVISMIRGHAFYTLLFELSSRFHLFEQPDTAILDEKVYTRLKAKDELEKDCVLYFDPVTNRLSRLHLQNPEQKDEIIKIEWSEWKLVRKFVLPHKVLIDQAGKLFVFEFTKIEINSSGFKKAEFPVE